jgi:hypothetical protein|tara:strand:+ start:747 stop:1082 length:336 start_codon:yes stop_codon:yes gene_type:complete
MKSTTPLYHVRHFKGTETHTIGKFTSKEKAIDLTRRFIKGIQNNLEKKGIYSIVALTHFNEPDINQDITMYTITDAKHNPIGEHNSLHEGAMISLITPSTLTDTNFNKHSL